MATPGPTILNIGTGTGANRYKLDYSLTAGGTVLTQTCAQLATFENANVFYQDGSWCMMRTDVDVDTIVTPGGYPRTELREMALDGTSLRAFNPTTGDHSASVCFKVEHLPPVKPSVVVLQMHDASDDVIEFAVQPRTDYATSGKVKLVCRVNGTSSGIPDMDSDFQLGMARRVKIRVGAIASGSTGWEAYYEDMSTPLIKSSDPGMPAMSTSGANSYFKTGCYSQTKYTGNGTGGLETNVNEYVLVGHRELQTSHNGETAPAQLTYGTDSTNIISNVRWGAKAEGVNTTGVSFTLTPALPASLALDDMVYVVCRARRSSPSTGLVATPAIESVSPSWIRLPPGGPEYVSSATYGTDLALHSQRLRIWVRPWFSGMGAPVLTYASGVSTDIMSAQCFAIAGGKLDADDVMDQYPTAFTYGATSTTVIGPSAALPANSVGGALALALLASEYNVTSGSINITSGDSLTWAEGGEGVGTTVSFQAWANDWAIVPAGAGQAIAAKQTTSTAARTTGKSASVLMTLRPAEKRTTGLIPASG